MIYFFYQDHIQVELNLTRPIWPKEGQLTFCRKKSPSLKHTASNM
jgi:hypothetical protein